VKEPVGTLVGALGVLLLGVILILAAFWLGS